VDRLRSRRQSAARIIAAGAALPSDRRLAAAAIRDLVDDGSQRRASAFYAAPPDVQAAIPGGFIVRAQVHDLSPEADRQDRLAIEIANAIPGISNEERLHLCL
jgi:hypothetical protein